MAKLSHTLARLLPICLAGLANAAGVCGIQDPLQAADQLYRQARQFYVEPAIATRFTAPPLKQALQREFKCSRSGQLCAIEADPWTDSQDDDPTQPASFTLAMEERQGAQLRYSLKLEADGAPVQGMLYLARQGDCWRIADLAGPEAKRLSARLTAWAQRK